MQIIIQWSAFLLCLLESIDQDQELEKCCMEQIGVDNMEDFTDKNVKVLPPHVEELKRQVSIKRNCLLCLLRQEIDF